MPRADYDSASAFVTRFQNLPMCSLSDDHGITYFYINPSTIEFQNERVQVTVPTLAGFGRFSYGTKPMVIRFDGMTGTGGLDALTALNRFRPQHNGPENPKPVNFRFPARFKNALRVYVNTFSDSMNAEAYLYHFYSIELVEFPVEATALPYNVLASTDVASVLLPPGGLVQLSNAQRKAQFQINTGT